MKRTALPKLTTAAIELPPARRAGTKSLEETLGARRSCRNFDPEPLPLECTAQLLWAAQGVTGLGGLRTAPSPAAVYGVRTYLVALDVLTLRDGVYAYEPDGHALSPRKAGDLRSKLKKACCDQEEVDSAAAAFVLTAVMPRLNREFGERGMRLALLECGHIAQNICLQATALALGALTYGKTDDAELKRVLDLPETEEPAYVILAGPRM